MYRYVVTMIILILAPTLAVAGQTPQYNDIGGLVSSSDWNKRYQGFLLLTKSGLPQSNEKQRRDFYVIELTELANAEIAVHERALKDPLHPAVPSGEGEAYSDYLVALYGSICALKDPRMIDLLLNPYVLGLGVGSVNTLANYGELSYSRVVVAYRENKSEDRLLYLMTLEAMIPTLTNSTHVQQVEGVMLEASRSSDGLERAISLDGLAHFHDPQALDRIRELAEHDPKEGIRMDAKGALLKLQRNP